MTATEWNKQFGLPGIAEISEGQGNLPRIHVTTPAATAEIYLHGAQITSWIPAGASEVLFLSRLSRWEEGRAIRAAFPSAIRGSAQRPMIRRPPPTASSAPQPGALSRSRNSLKASSSRSPSPATMRRAGSGRTTFISRIASPSARSSGLSSSRATRAPKPSGLKRLCNTYFHVADVKKVSVSGLDGVSFLDNVHGNSEHIQQGNLGMTGATDNAYLDTASAVTVIDPVLNRTLITEKTNSNTTIAWNPWRQGASSLADLGDDRVARNDLRRGFEHSRLPDRGSSRRHAHIRSYSARRWCIEELRASSSLNRPIAQWPQPRGNFCSRQLVAADKAIAQS